MCFVEDKLEKQTVEFRFATFSSLMTGAVRLASDFRVVVTWGYEGSPVPRAAAGSLILLVLTSERYLPLS